MIYFKQEHRFLQRYILLAVYSKDLKFLQMLGMYFRQCIIYRHITICHMYVMCTVFTVSLYTCTGYCLYSPYLLSLYRQAINMPHTVALMELPLNESARIGIWASSTRPSFVTFPCGFVGPSRGFHVAKAWLHWSCFFQGWLAKISTTLFASWSWLSHWQAQNPLRHDG